MIGDLRQLVVGADQPDQVEPADMRQLDVGDDKIGTKAVRGVQRLAAVGDRFRLVAVRREQVAEQLDVEGIVLDDQDLGQAIPLPSPREPKPCRRRRQMTR